MTGKIAIRMQEITPFYVMELLQRARQLEHQGRDIVHMEIGESDFPTPDAIVKAGINYIKTGQDAICVYVGCDGIREKISRYYQEQYSVGVESKRIFITPGASGAFLLAFGVSLNTGDGVLLADPGYPCNSNFIRLFGAEPKLIPVNTQTDFQLSAKLIRQNWQENTKAALIASPSNPTGTIIS